ncbi:uncharacterized protein ACA1_040810 [Acanthamoeba castellanii str. Neff]|uniref:Uncharacterized protein n=1 Tax=Acanthamoeba castellanii (strain ATCC 30010 / Neff) TaxID=1257118 RepID=L8H0K0_ACACF|nr:uncharacterized protein ACA1_040810 [Acanthamoeba castellanii str. Neff]ELR18765.1 hypothetical protein ACA1_040810 [Acanthamoeba castellanii str. Neff]
MSSALHSARPLANTVIRRSTEKLYGQQAHIGREAQHRVIFLRTGQDKFFYGVATSVAGAGIATLLFGATRLATGNGKREE